MTKLSVNLNKIALLRNSRNLGIPSVIEAAKTVIRAGAYGVTVHPRPDERHTRYTDAYELSQLVHSHPGIEYNIEGNPFTGRFMQILRDIKPDQATLVPDAHDASTSDHGWDLVKDGSRLTSVINELKGIGIRVSLFMDSDSDGIRTAKQLNADRVELYTEPFAKAFNTQHNLDSIMQKYIDAAVTAQNLGLGLNAGHDLNLQNLGFFSSRIPGLLEVSIGHALIADAIDIGLYNTVKAYLEVLEKNK